MAEDKKATHQVTVAHASFWFDQNGRNRVATRGSTITVNDEDYERGTAHGAFVASPADLVRLGELPSLAHLYEDGQLDPDEDDVEEVTAWMRSAAPSDVQAAVAQAAAEGVDITGLLAAAEMNRGSEARPEVLGNLAITYAAAVHDDEPDEPEAPAASAVSSDPQEPASTLVDEPAAPVAQPGEPESDKIDDILAWVGDDVARAGIALEKEQREKADKARPRLVSQLQERMSPDGVS